MRTRALALLVLVCALVACGGATKRQATLKATLVAVDQARDVVIRIDATAQDLILDTSTTKEQFTERITAYRKIQRKLLDGFEATYKAIAVAAITDDDTSLTNMLMVFQNLIATFDKFKKDHDQ